MTSRPHLDHLEDEAIEIIREAGAQAACPVILYSIGKDSSVLLHLAAKAYAPGPMPFPLLHIDTGWKFREMIAFRDQMAAATGHRLLVHSNPRGGAEGISPFSHGPEAYTRIMKTDTLRQALEAHGFDLALGGARRDEEVSRAKERIMSIRAPGHVWDPRRQRPEFWSLYNARVSNGASVRCFPLSNWTERDVWHYIRQEGIPVVPLYFARPRPVVRRQGQWIMVDDQRLPLAPGEVPETRMVRFRTLGCYPLTAACDSTASSLDAIIAELEQSDRTERHGRLIDHDAPAAMERKKREGYF